MAQRAFSINNKRVENYLLEDSCIIPFFPLKTNKGICHYKICLYVHQD